MLLRANSELTGQDTDLKAVTAGSGVDSGIPHGQLLTEFVEVTLGGSEDDRKRATEVRTELVDAMNAEALVDAAGIIGNFQRMVRIADGTGIPLDRPVSVISANLRSELGIDKFGSADRTPKVGAILAWLAEKLAPIMLKRLARSGKAVN